MTDDQLRKSIRAIATLQYVVASILVVSSILLLISGRDLWLRLIGVPILAGLAVFLFVLAGSVRKFRPWARTPTVIMSFIGVVAFPLGTLIYGPFLYVLAKGKHLFAQQAPPSDAPQSDIDRLAA